MKEYFKMPLQLSHIGGQINWSEQLRYEVFKASKTIKNLMPRLTLETKKIINYLIMHDKILRKYSNYITEKFGLCIEASFFQIRW